MRYLILASTLLLALGLTSCRKAPQEKGKEHSGKAELGRTKVPLPAPAPAEKPDKAPAESEKQEEAPKKAEEKLTASSGEPEERLVISDRNKEGLDIEPDSCKSKVEAHERKLQKDVLPMMRAEGEATVHIERWVRSTYNILDDSKSKLLKEQLADFWVEWDECVKKQPEEPGENRDDPLEMALRTLDGSGCAKLTSKRGQEFCVRLVAARQRHSYLADWRRTGFSPAFCRKSPPPMGRMEPLDIWKNGATDSAMCSAIVAHEDCGDKLQTALKQQLVEAAAMCKAAQTGFSGAGCSGNFPEGSTGCEVVKMAQAPDLNSYCHKLELSGALPFAPEVCRSLDMFKEFDCDSIATKADETTVQKGMADTCRMVAAIKAGKKSCEGIFEEESESCLFFKTHMAAVPTSTPPPDQGFKLGPGGKPRYTFPDKPGPGEETGEDPLGNFLSLYFAAMGEMNPDSPTKWGKGSWDDTPCRKVLWSQSVLPASEGRTELRLTIVNPIDDPAKCALKVEATGKSSSATQSGDLEFKTGEVKTVSYFFVADEGTSFKVTPTCTWTRGVNRKTESQ